MSRTGPLGVEPPAIVRSEVDIETLLRDARMFGRQTVEAAVKAGELLLRAKAVCPHGQWIPLIGRFGFTQSTAKRLMATARTDGKSPNLGDLTGTAGDDPPAPTTSPTTFATPIYCRPCRTGKPKEGCKACKALRKNQPKLFEPPAPEAPPAPPEPTGDAAEEVADAVLRDAEGLVLPERVRPYLEDDAIDAWVKAHGRPAFDAMKELQGRPGASHVDVPLLAKKLSAVSRMVKSAKLTHRCPECSGEGCETCANTGLLSKALWSER